MHDGPSRPLDGRRLLLVEDDYFIASDMTQALETVGVHVVGPAASVADALELIESASDPLDGAVLDVNLGEERVYPVADALAARSVPFVFVTGYDAATIPETYSKAPRCEKPVDRELLTRMLLRVGVV
jgi:CheY-like chemotaxis protein